MRDDQSGDPIVVADFNQLIGLLMQAFNIQAQAEKEANKPANEPTTEEAPADNKPKKNKQ